MMPRAGALRGAGGPKGLKVGLRAVCGATGPVAASIGRQRPAGRPGRKETDDGETMDPWCLQVSVRTPVLPGLCSGAVPELWA